MNTLKHSGGMDVINHMFTNISDDPRIQLIIIGFMFGAFIEGAAGFGTPAALAAPLLISVGFPPLCRHGGTLVLNSTPVPFGAVGAPAATAFNMVSGVAESGIANGGLETWIDKMGCYSKCNHLSNHHFCSNVHDVNVLARRNPSNRHWNVFHIF